MNYPKRFVDIQDLKRLIKPIDFYSREQRLTRLKKSGKWMEGGICPFHSDKNPGSFHIHLETGSYQCFSCGAKGGDIVTFTMSKYGLSLKETLEKLKKEWGV